MAEKMLGTCPECKKKDIPATAVMVPLVVPFDPTCEPGGGTDVIGEARTYELAQHDVYSRPCDGSGGSPEGCVYPAAQDELSSGRGPSLLNKAVIDDLFDYVPCSAD